MVRPRSLLLLLAATPLLTSALTCSAVQLPCHSRRMGATLVLMKAGKGKGKGGSRREQRRQRREAEKSGAAVGTGPDAVPAVELAVAAEPVMAVESATAAEPAPAAAEASSAQAAVEAFNAASQAAFEMPSSGEGKIESISQSLPSLDDFKRRDDEAAAKEVRRSRRGGRGAEESTAPPSEAAAAKPEGPMSASEKLMELLSFDAIDERPAVEQAEYDATARLIGRGLPNKAGAYLLPYLQSGHMLLLGVLLLSSFVTYPGFPLTQVPDEYRNLLKEGLVLNYVFNLAAAFYSRGIAEKKEQPVLFWTVKVALLGGLALGELSEAVPDPKPKGKGKRA